MKAVHFNASTIEALMESLYELNKKLLVREGRMLRLATGEGVKRESFIEHYLNFNFEKNWIQNLLNLNDKNWEKFINKNHIEINKLIEEITLVTANRPPNTREIAIGKQLLNNPSRRQGIEDFLWVMMNSYDFLFVK